MIRIDRRSVPSPLNPDLVARTKARLVEWYHQPSEIRLKQKLDPGERITINREARDALVLLFHNKCAYCESQIGVTTPGEIDRFRPYTDACNLSGEGSSDHYGWLSADWDNLYFACPSCARSKRSLFPVEGPRAEPLTPMEQVRSAEQALLVDPCFDNPADHLQFVDTGYVQARSNEGEVTIKVLNLNREGLVSARAEVWKLAGAQALYSESGESHQALISPDRPYSAVARAAVEATLAAQAPRLVREGMMLSVPRERRSAEEILAEDAEAFRLSARPLRRVEITNFRALRNVNLEFGEPGSERAPWLVLLGENATGKSSVLQAIALALAGADEARRRVRPERLLSVGAFQGSIVIWFWDQDAPVELYFRRRGARFEGTRGASAIVLGYGALRYAERRQRNNDFSPRFSKIAPIIEPIARIRYPGQWLLALDEKRFDTAARALQSVLPVGIDSVMFRSNNRIYFDVGGHRASLAELSAGYQTIVGMCSDIMRLLFERWDTLSSATAIVLIDEIDAHLHPRWTMRIVGALREAFPQVQFVASTHDPLALRGLRNGEVALLRRDNEGAVIADQNLPPLEGMQVDQLLTSRAFGLESTVDPETEALLDEYYHLRSLPSEPSQDARIQEIRGRVADREALGRSESERLMIEVTDDYVRKASDNSAENEPLRAETLQLLREIADRSAHSRRRREQ
jgi:hypothetical protein